MPIDGTIPRSRIFLGVLAGPGDASALILYGFRVFFEEVSKIST